jgi:hypothetical protein
MMDLVRKFRQLRRLRLISIVICLVSAVGSVWQTCHEGLVAIPVLILPFVSGWLAGMLYMDWMIEALGRAASLRRESLEAIDPLKPGGPS